MTLSIIIPAYNEEKTIEEIIKRVNGVFLPVEKEIIVVNDGSSDSTSAILNKLKENIKFILVEYEKNRGKGAAIKAALPFVGGDFAVVQDADLELDPRDLSLMLGPVMKNKAKVVYGSRTLNKNNIGQKGKVNIPFLLGGVFLTSLANILYDSGISDEAIGYKMIESKLLRELNLTCNGFDFCPEVTAKVAKRGIKIYEVPVSYNPRSKEEGKKIRWKDGVKAAWTLIKYRFIN